MARQQQMKAQLQQQYAQAVAQQVAAQQQAQAQAYQQAVAQYQAAQIEQARQMIMQQAIQAQIQAQITQYIDETQIAAQEQAMLKQAIEEELARRIAAQIQQGIAVKVQQAMMEQAIAQAVQKLQMQAYVKEALQTKVAATAAQAAATRPFEPVSSDQVQDVVDISQVWQKLENNSKAWALLIDNEAKVMTVNEFIDRFRKEGVRIQKPPAYYAHMIDDMASQNPQMLLKPFKEVLEILAVMEYDFNNGMDPDQLAQKVLGPQFYQENRKRLGK